MPSMIRTSKKAMKIAYKILNTPKDKRQDKDIKPTEKMIKAWQIDSYKSQ